jgi:hypothetical protein
MIRAVARDKLQDDLGKCIGRKFSVWDLHRWEPVGQRLPKQPGTRD